MNHFLRSTSSARTRADVRLWDAVTAEALVELRNHDNFVFCVDVHSNLVVTGSFDETVKLWDIRTGDCISTLPAGTHPKAFRYLATRAVVCIAKNVQKTLDTHRVAHQMNVANACTRKLAQ